MNKKDFEKKLFNILNKTEEDTFFKQLKYIIDIVKKYNYYEFLLTLLKKYIKSNSSSKGKYFSLIFIKEIMKFEDDKIINYFIKKLSVRLFKLADFGLKKKSIIEKGKNCLKQYNNEINSDYSLKFYVLLIECWIEWNKNYSQSHKKIKEKYNKLEKNKIFYSNNIYIYYPFYSYQKDDNLIEKYILLYEEKLKELIKLVNEEKDIWNNFNCYLNIQYLLNYNNILNYNNHNLLNDIVNIYENNIEFASLIKLSYDNLINKKETFIEFKSNINDILENYIEIMNVIKNESIKKIEEETIKIDENKKKENFENKDNIKNEIKEESDESSNNSINEEKNKILLREKRLSSKINNILKTGANLNNNNEIKDNNEIKNNNDNKELKKEQNENMVDNNIKNNNLIENLKDNLDDDINEDLKDNLNDDINEDLNDKINEDLKDNLNDDFDNKFKEDNSVNDEFLNLEKKESEINFKINIIKAEENSNDEIFKNYNENDSINLKNDNNPFKFTENSSNFLNEKNDNFDEFEEKINESNVFFKEDKLEENKMDSQKKENELNINVEKKIDIISFRDNFNKGEEEEEKIEEKDLKSNLEKNDNIDNNNINENKKNTDFNNDDGDDFFNNFENQEFELKNLKKNNSDPFEFKESPFDSIKENSKLNRKFTYNENPNSKLINNMKRKNDELIRDNNNLIINNNYLKHEINLLKNNNIILDDELKKEKEKYNKNLDININNKNNFLKKENEHFKLLQKNDNLKINLLTKKLNKYKEKYNELINDIKNINLLKYDKINIEIESMKKIIKEKEDLIIKKDNENKILLNKLENNYKELRDIKIIFNKIYKEYNINSNKINIEKENKFKKEIEKKTITKNNININNKDYHFQESKNNKELEINFIKFQSIENNFNDDILQLYYLKACLLSNNSILMSNDNLEIKMLSKIIKNNKYNIELNLNIKTDFDHYSIYFLTNVNHEFKPENLTNINKNNINFSIIIDLETKIIEFPKINILINKVYPVKEFDLILPLNIINYIDYIKINDLKIINNLKEHYYLFEYDKNLISNINDFLSINNKFHKINDNMLIIGVKVKKDIICYLKLNMIDEKLIKFSCYYEKYDQNIMNYFKTFIWIFKK